LGMVIPKLNPKIGWVEGDKMRGNRDPKFNWPKPYITTKRMVGVHSTTVF